MANFFDTNYFKTDFFKQPFFTQNDFFNEPFFGGIFTAGTASNTPLKAVPFTERICYGLGASIGSGTITVSPYVLVNGVDEKTSMSAIHVMDGNTHKLKLAYQSGLTDGNISDTIPLEMADSFANTGAKEVYFSINTVHAGQHVLGDSMKTFVADGTELQGWYDSVEDKFFIEEI